MADLDVSCAACNGPVEDDSRGAGLVEFCGDCRERSRPSDLPDYYDDVGGGG